MSDNKFRFSQDECPVCNQTFQTDDDIVVCPQCGTPHHRECYKQNGTCSNADKHNDGFCWESVSSQDDKPQATKPFENEQKEGFEELDVNNSPFLFPIEMSVQNPLNLLPKELEEGVSTEDVAFFVQQDTTRYIQKFFYIKGGKNKWNWAAMFFAPYWFFYRKLYKHGAIVMAIMLCLSFLSYLPPVERFMTTMAQYQEDVVSLGEQNLSEEEYINTFNELTTKAQKAILDNKQGAGILAVQSLSSILLSIFIGLNANRWYYKHVVKNIKDIHSKVNTREATQQLLYKTGGIAFGITFLAVLVEKIIIIGFDLILMYFNH